MLPLDSLISLRFNFLNTSWAVLVYLQVYCLSQQCQTIKTVMGGVAFQLHYQTLFTQIQTWITLACVLKSESKRTYNARGRRRSRKKMFCLFSGKKMKIVMVCPDPPSLSFVPSLHHPSQRVQLLVWLKSPFLPSDSPTASSVAWEENSFPVRSAKQCSSYTCCRIIYSFTGAHWCLLQVRHCAGSCLDMYMNRPGSVWPKGSQSSWGGRRGQIRENKWSRLSDHMLWEFKPGKLTSEQGRECSIWTKPWRIGNIYLEVLFSFLFSKVHVFQIKFGAV